MPGMIVKNNMSAIHSLNTLNKNQTGLAKSLQKVSSGMRLNGAADDASAYAISERMRVQIRSLDQADRNTQNGISLLKVAGGAVQSTVDILRSLKEKVINAANDSNTDEDRQQLQKELNQYIDQINDNANVTYNGKYLIDGSHNSVVKLDDCFFPGRGSHRTNLYTTGRGTYTHLTNASLDANTSWNTPLTTLKNRNGEDLGIRPDDRITISIVQQGKTFMTEFLAGTNYLSEVWMTAYLGDPKYGDEAIDAPGLWPGEHTALTAEAYIGHDASGNYIYSPDGEPVLTMLSGGPGLPHQVAGFTLSVSDSEGNIKKSVNAVLDAWKETIRAQNESEDNSLVLQTGTKANQAIKVGFADMRAYALGLEGSDGTKLNITTQAYANAAINVLDNAIEWALSEQTKIGSVANRLESTSANLITAAENVTASESTIRDADMAREMMEYTKNNVLLQASQSMLSQANQNSSNVLSLLQ